MTLIELIWTITPALILIAIAFPSFKLLYMLDFSSTNTEILNLGAVGFKFTRNFNLIRKNSKNVSAQKPKPKLNINNKSITKIQTRG